MNAQEYRQLTYAFAIGDALGSVFESESPSHDEIDRRFDGSEPLNFTDDTHLLLTTLSAMSSLSTLDNISWDSFYEHTCKALHKWYVSGDLRGIGDTTYQALKLLDWHSSTHSSFSNFELSDSGYNKKWSAGNGALSRSIPLLASHVDLSGFPITRWVQITHFHQDAINSVALLNNYLKTHEIPPSLEKDEMRGFYCLETLEIAINAVESSSSLREVFRKSIVPDGDNDSISALSFSLWLIRHGYDEFIDIERRINTVDRAALDIDIRNSFFIR